MSRDDRIYLTPSSSKGRRGRRFFKDFHWSPISKEEGVFLRACAILAIVFHNYLHWVSDSPGENEFRFSRDHVDAFLSALAASPLDAPRLVATYLGHYGVQIFFFLSGYGLAMKYTNQSPSWFSFQKSRWRSLFPAVLIAAFGYLLYDGIRLGWQHVFAVEGVNLIRQILGVSNFIPDNIYHPIGPWWFIGVILQFYLLTPIILTSTRRYGNLVLYGLMLASLLMEWFLAPVLASKFDFNINHSILGHLDVCVFGIWMARQKKVTIPSLIFAIGAIFFVIGNFNEWLWVTTGLTSLVVFIPPLRLLHTQLRYLPLFYFPLLWIGNLSLFMFLTNGYLRNPLIEVAQKSPHWTTSAWTSLTFLAIVIVWSALLRWLLNFITPRRP